MNKKLLLIIFCCIYFLSAGCSKNNIFSWEHKPGNGSYSDLMSDGNAAMQKKDYTKAKELYRAAIKAKPDDNNAIMEYAAAVIADIFPK
jgi:outer membrane protein assembly factor BamD (BamD/ComL family)